MKNFFTRLALLAFLFCSVNSSATHLMGGNLSYTFVSFNPGNNTYTYSVELRIYRYCTGMTTGLDPSMSLGVYHENPAFPNADKILYNTFSIPLVSQQFITPPNPNPNCTFASNVCVEEGIYRTTIVLASSAGGYHLIVERCCRNNNISNLDNPQAAAQVYYASIPPSATTNSSPSFSSVPVPFICAGDTTSILNSAFDADGDSLSFAFVTPYNGTASSMNPIPTPTSPYPWPISEVNFDVAAGYDLIHPFGPGGYSFIDPTTGLASYMSPAQGFYVVAVEVTEFRNGVQIGVMRRDLQIIVIPCPVNNAPTFAAGATTFTVPEGTNLCFPVAVTDIDGDSIFLTANSPIFDAAQTNPPATFTTTSGPGTGNGQFCWPTSCTQGRASSYQFTVSALDNGCPAKTSNVVYTINVLPTTISPITGPDTVCTSSTSTSIYSVLPEGFTYQWTITGGSQVSGGTTETAGVQWSSGSGTVSVYAVNSQNCHSDTSTMNVVASNPVADAGPNVSFCSGDSAMLGAAAIPNQTYAWSPATGLSNSTVSNPVVTLVNVGATPVVVQYVLTVAQPGCSSGDTVSVTVNPQPAVSIAGNPPMCISNGPTPLAGTPIGGIFSGPGVSGATFDPAVAGIGIHTITYFYSNAFGCSGTDSTTLTVTALPAVVAGNDFSRCIDGSPVALSGLPAGGTFSGPGVGAGSFNPATAGVGTHSIIYNYSDSSGCANSDTLVATVNALPVVSAGSYPSVCVNAVPVALSGTPAGGTFSGTGVIGSSFDPAAAGAGTHAITYAYSDSNGCSASQATNIVVNPLPQVNAGVDFSLCIDAGAVALAGTPAGGTYVGAGITGVNFDPAVAGVGIHVITYNYADSSGCSASDVLNITVNALPVVSLGSFTSLCTTSPPLTLTGGSPAGGTYSGTGVSNGVFDPIVAGVGAFVITYSYTDANGCSAQATSPITVFLQPVVSFTPPASTCINSAPIVLTGGSPAGGTYSGPGVSNGSFDPAAAGLGTHTLTYTVAGGGGCTGSATTVISVGTEPQVSLAVSQGIGCQQNTIFTGYGPQHLVITATTSSTGVTYAWYKDGVLLPGRVSDTLQVTVAGVYNVVVTESSGCSSSPVNPASISTIFVVDVRCGHNMNKVVLCHVPPGNPGNPQTLCIAPSAVPAHLGNHPGDCLGPCPNQRIGVEISGNLQLHMQPNPFTDRTVIEFTAFDASDVTLELFDMEGKFIRQVYTGTAEHDILYTVPVDGSKLAGGVYFIRATCGSESTYHKLVKTR